MPKQNAVILAYNRGVVAARALGRTDIERMAWSAEQQENWKPAVLGSMMLRPGLGYLLNTSTALPKYLPFVFAVDDTALIEFTDGEARPLVDDAPLTIVSTSTAVSNGTFGSLTNWTDADDSGATSSLSTGSGAVVALTERTVYDYETDGTATAKFKLDNDGIAYTMRDVLDSSTYQAVSGEWYISGGVGAYEFRATIVSGTLTTGTTGSWLTSGTDREWTVARGSTGTKTCVFDLEIRLTGATTTLATARITLQATKITSGGTGGGPLP